MPIELLKDKTECSGCWACANICPKDAITMEADDEGFKFPRIDGERCIGCRLCVRVCPIKNRRTEREELNAEKHIGIINLQFTPNYGAVIAAAVLEDTVRELVGEDTVVQTVNYMPNKPFPNRLAALRDEARQWGGWKLFLKQKYRPAEHSEERRRRAQRFTVFRETFLHLTPYCENTEEIAKDVNFAAFITGSDVVWAPKRSDNYRADAYYLKFAEEGVRRIAYAPSLDTGDAKQLKRLAGIYRENIKSLDCLSVREQSNVAFLQSLTDKKVSCCCDPAFLADADYYEKMLAPVGENDEKYIYVYILEINQDIVDYANRLSAEKGLKICYYSPNHNEYSGHAENCISDGPSEFLSRLKNASYVLTNSYHCVVFSLIFKKQFLSFTRSKTSIKSSDLLSAFHLSDRIVSDPQTADIDRPIDFDQAEAVLQTIKKDSLDYLKKALKGI